MQLSLSKIIISTEVLLFLLLFSCGKSSKDVVTGFHKRGEFNGVLLMAKDGKVIENIALGSGNFGTKKTLTTDTPFYIASLSKPFTATAIILLQQKGLLSYDDKASKYINELPVYAKDVTIKELLTHTSGIPDYEPVLSNTKGLTNPMVLEWLKQQKGLKFPSGRKFAYSNSGYIILSLVIEKISDQSYSSFLKEHIFIPTGMKNTQVYDQSMPTIKNRALGYTQKKQPDDYSLLTTGDGGIYSTTEDLYQFDQALRNFSLINKDNTLLMYTPFTLSNGTTSNYGFGWYIEESSTGKKVWHTGGLNGFRTLFWRDIQHNKTIIALTNQGDAFPIDHFLSDLKHTF